MARLQRGLYEQLVTEALEQRLEVIADELNVQRDPLSPAEAPDRMALHVGRVLRWALEGLDDRERVPVGVAVLRQVVRCIDDGLRPRKEGLGEQVALEAPTVSGELVRALLGYRPDGSPEEIASPLTPLLDTTLLTNAPGEPRVGSQVLAEIGSADSIDVVMAFIRRSGLRPMLEALRRHCDAGRKLRVLTTTYTGSTELEALTRLRDLGAEIRVSYDTSVTRLHAKAWLFRRASGFSTAYIGSSNLTQSAQINGLEWNVRVSGARNPDVIEKVEAVFESYWNSPDFERFVPEQFEQRTQARPSEEPGIFVSPVELRLEPFQERMLEQIEVARTRGHHENLLVSATGTGKTVMAAVDYARLRRGLPRTRLLFVAHRAELLKQSRATFAHALREPAFGELWVDDNRPRHFEHVFASIQSLSAAGYGSLDPSHFDVVIVDEFHHAAASSYEALLGHLRPRELLGLTATPERSDGLPILQWFGGRIAAELRLWDAIDQHRLTPFLYYGIHDGLDLQRVPWRRGRGYDVEALTNVLTADEASARLVLKELREHAESPSTMRVLGFCVSVDHARFMARVFEAGGCSARAVWADTPREEREAALRDLAEGRLRVVFSVDLFNEGVDVPDVDTLLLLRPTESSTLFLQQLGRGLRRSAGKAACTVLDFVGQHRREFRFDRRMRALLGGSRTDVVRQIEGGFPLLPAGCHMELDPVARDVVLRSIRSALPSRWPEKIAELQAVARDAPGKDVTLGEFLQETGLEVEDVYQGTKSWSDLRFDAGLQVHAAGPKEEVLRRALGRLLHIDDQERLDEFRRLAASEQPPHSGDLEERRRRLLRMMVASLVGQAVDKGSSLQDGVQLLWKHPQVLSEFGQLLDVVAERIDHAHAPLPGAPHVPLQVHARYTRREILAALGSGTGARIPSWQQGVRWLPEEQTDVFAFTLDKTTGHFSPTTRYQDYAISLDLIHWESQSVTRADSETGQRYQGHEESGTRVLLFARRNTTELSFWFLGPATYVTHRGERPMAITWRLAFPLPGDLFAAFAAAVA